MAPKDYPNGAIVFCSEGTGEAVHPPTPLRHRVYSCGRHFETSTLHTMIKAQHGPTHGVIAIDGSEATLGTVQGLCSGMNPVVTRLGHITSTTASRTRRGGQSALRYSRLRDEAELAFLRKVGEIASNSFKDVCGLIVAGKADMKRKLLPELADPLRRCVLCTIDLGCNADADALRQAAYAAAEVVGSSEHTGVDSALSRFFELTIMPDVEASRCCYGAVQVLAAIKMGAVDELLIASDYKGQERTVEDWKSLAATHGATVVEIMPRSGQSVRFCQSFGIGGILRWALDPGLLDDEVADHTEVPDAVLPDSQLRPGPSLPEPFAPIADMDTTELPDAVLLDSKASQESGGSGPGAFLPEPCAPIAEMDTNSVSTADCSNGSSQTCAKDEFFSWLRAEMDTVLDPTASEALCICVDVILTDETTSTEEALSQAVAVLLEEGVSIGLGLELTRRWQGVVESGALVQ